MSTERKIPIDEFCQMTGKTKRQVNHLCSIHAGLKSKVKGERSVRINLDKWERILKTA
jgi:alpha-L-arabinofuranosidase